MMRFDCSFSTLACGHRGKAGFSISSVPKALWLDPSDPNTTFQDATGITPATAMGQNVGALLDKSGSGYDFTQGDLAKQPVLSDEAGITGLLFDGVADVLTASNRLGLGADPDLCLFVAMNTKSNAVSDGRVWDLGDGAGSLAGALGTDGWSWRHDNGNSRYGAVPTDQVLVARWERNAGDPFGDCRFFVNNVAQSQVSNGNGAGLAGNSIASTTIGAHPSGSRFANFALLELIVLDHVPDAGTMANIENYLALKAGV